MSEVIKDPAIKLFGKTIQLPSIDQVSDLVHCEPSSDRNLSCSDDKDDAAVDSKQEDNSSSTIIVEANKEPTKSSTSDNLTIASDASQKEEESESGSSSQEKPLKKPDKIIPCPRCNSMDTKFCYFNNYNVNQPRHFCKNCQRYWTAGGTMRNVPVGAGRRKSKNSPHHRHIVIPDVYQVRPDGANGMIYPALRPNDSVLAFDSDAPLCESMASALNIADKSAHCIRNGFVQPEVNVHETSEVRVNLDKQESSLKSFHGFTSQVPCFPAPPWPHPWNPAQWNAAVPAPPFLPAGFPVSIYATPPPYWGCRVPGSWSIPWMQLPAASGDHSSTSSSPSSPLGKHSRDGNGEESRTDSKVLTPKTLRIDDPNEAAKSSIWATLGIKNEKAECINSGGLFRGFKMKDDDTKSVADTSLVLQANPAALSRSLKFHERAK